MAELHHLAVASQAIPGEPGASATPVRDGPAGCGLPLFLTPSRCGPAQAWPTRKRCGAGRRGAARLSTDQPRCAWAGITMPEHWCDEPMARAGNDQCHINYSPVHRLCKRLVISSYPQPVTGALNPLRGTGCGRCVPQQECHQPPRATRPSRVCTVSCQGRRRRYRCRLVPRRKRRHRHRYRVATASPNAVPAKSQEHRRTTSDGTADPQRRRSGPTDVNGSTTLETSRIGSPLTLRTRPRSDEEERA